MVSSTLVDDYEASLRDLTFNSKPIIDNLTIIAKEHTDEAQGIVRVITNRIYKCIPEHKLHALYLLDSICKTAGPPYNEIFGQEIFKIFSHTYVLVNSETRARLVKIYELWKTLNSKGSSLPLFPTEQLDKIGNFLRQALARTIEEPVTLISQPALVADIEGLILILKQIPASDASINLVPSRITALDALKEYLKLQKLSQTDLKDVQQKLMHMKLQVSNPESVNSTQGNLNLLLQGGPTAPALSHNEAQAVSEQTEPLALDLFENLISSGLVKVDQSLKAGSKPEYELVIPKQKYTPQAFDGSSSSFLSNFLQNAHLSQMPQHEQIKYKEIIKIESKLADRNSYTSDLQLFIFKNVLDPSTVQVLYEVKSLKCSQCGKRFATDDNGAIQKRLHLDWHFRINKRQANFKTNVQSRNWYLDNQSWVHFQESELSELEPTGAKKDSLQSLKMPEQNYVLIPSDETNMNNVCAICREHIKPSINPTTEEWVWSGCMLAPGNKSGRKIVHIACFEEANRKRVAEDEGNNRVKRERY